MKFDMHCHTKEGSMDGKVIIDEYIRLLKEKGFGGMLVSDHNSYDGYRQWKNAIKGSKYEDFVVLKGVEYDTLDCGHILVIMPENVKLKILELRGLPVFWLIKIVHHYGGILGPAHPFGEQYLSIIKTRIKKGYRRSRLKPLIDAFDFIEIFNACEGERENASAKRLAMHYHKPGLGGSDAHKTDCIGMAYTELPDNIRCESDLISYIKTAPEIECGGSYYTRRTKDRLGKWNNVLVQGFYLFNKGAAWTRGLKRRREVRKLKKEDSPLILERKNKKSI